MPNGRLYYEIRVGGRRGRRYWLSNPIGVVILPAQINLQPQADRPQPRKAHFQCQNWMPLDWRPIRLTSIESNGSQPHLVGTRGSQSTVTIRLTGRVRKDGDELLEAEAAAEIKRLLEALDRHFRRQRLFRGEKV